MTVRKGSQLSAKTAYGKQARTKIVATAGPASNSKEKIRELILAGVNVFRLNMAHGTNDEKEEIIANIRGVSEELKSSTAILVDIAGPKIRLGKLHNDAAHLINGETVTFVRGIETDNPKHLVCLYEPLIDEVNIGDMIVLADGISRLVVTEKSADEVVCEVSDGGTVRTRQGVNLPATKLSIPALGEKDIAHAKWAAGVGVDYVSLSFVSNEGEVNMLKEILRECDCHAPVIAKIEKAEALENLDSIVAAADGIMVARGDLGVEIDIAQTPLAQKGIIDCCSRHRKPVIVATQMLESMHHCKQPTRAEVSDVANAIFDGADACMLSGETAVGEYPVESVEMMNRIMLETEKTFENAPARVLPPVSRAENVLSEVFASTAAEIAKKIGAKLVVIGSSTTETALLKSKHRGFLHAVCITDSPEAARQMNLFWGVVPVVGPSSPGAMQESINEVAKKLFGLKVDDPIVIVSDTEIIPGAHDSIVVSKIT